MCDAVCSGDGVLVILSVKGFVGFDDPFPNSVGNFFHGDGVIPLCEIPRNCRFCCVGRPNAETVGVTVFFSIVGFVNTHKIVGIKIGTLMKQISGQGRFGGENRVVAGDCVHFLVILSLHGTIISYQVA